MRSDLVPNIENLSVNDVTFVVIGKNEASNLERCFQSIKKYSNQIIYVDSSSSDNSLDVAKELNISKILKLKSSYYSASLGRVVGAMHVNTKCIQFLDGDMTIESDWLEFALEKINSNNKIAVVHGFKKEFKKNVIDYVIKSDTKDWQSDYLQGAYLIKTKIYKDAGGLDPNFPGEEERDFYIRIRELGYQVWYIHQLMASHYDFKLRGYKYLFNSEVAGAIFVPLMKSIKNGTMKPYFFVYRRLMPSLFIDIISSFLLLMIVIFQLEGLFLWLIALQMSSFLYAFIIKRIGYFIIWKSAFFNIHRSFRIYNRTIEYSVEEI